MDSALRPSRVAASILLFLLIFFPEITPEISLAVHPEIPPGVQPRNASEVLSRISS